MTARVEAPATTAGQATSAYPLPLVRSVVAIPVWVVIGIATVMAVDGGMQITGMCGVTAVPEVLENPAQQAPAVVHFLVVVQPMM